ncbi:MAG TPA: hypothetical protein VMS11_03255 [Solirubrobacterales bacterium]|nr:hypothetical protein [Solirubrobacterales bacterium]
MRGRILVAKRSRAARKAEVYISGYTFPSHIERRVRRKLPQLDDAGWALVEQGLREWFICCAWRGRTVLGMPSRAVDEAWHEFILDSLGYTAFCDAAFGEYLHHTPDEALSAPMDGLLADTVRAWDRSEMGRGERESVLWDLDRRLGIEEPFGLTEVELISARTRSPYPLATGWAYAVGDGSWSGGGNGGGHHHGGGEGGGGCGTGGGGEAGGGCGGGSGCGGGGCGGGSS